MTRLFSHRLAATLAGLALAAGCSSGAPAQTATSQPATSTTPAVSAESEAAPDALAPSEPFGVTTVVLRDPGSDQRIEVPVYDAFAQEMRRLGLMHREQLPADAGMVFRFPQDTDGGFWMRNTLIPLSIAYFAADGEIVRILDMEPCRTVTCPSYPPEAVYRGALEVNQGFFAEHGVEAGWYIDVPQGLPEPS